MRLAVAAFLLVGTMLLAQTLRADQTYVYAVQISASVQAFPPQITLTWEPDPYGARSYTVFRKSKESSSWGNGAVLSGNAANYIDRDVTVGSTYEYQIIKESTRDYTGYGYIYTGIAAPLIDSRGKLILLVANDHAAALASELNLLQSDLVGDGWEVQRHDVSPNDSPSNIKALVTGIYRSDPAQVKALSIFGHIPVFRSGALNYDTHGERAMPSDAFYADVDGDWSASPSFLPSDVELMAGRVDFFNMPGTYAPSPWPSQVELLRNYLRKNHRWRHKQMSVPRRALMGNRAGDQEGEAPAACGYRNFQAFVGSGNIFEANIQDNAPVSERWISRLTSGSYLWAYGSGGGDYTSISHLGAQGLYNSVTSYDLVAQDPRAVFWMLYGSHFGEWDARDNIMRATLATPSLGLAVCLGGRPHWYLHHAALGEPIGYGARLTMNNESLYLTQTNAFTRGVHIALLGDPTLRLEPVAPPSDFRFTRTASGVNLTWAPSQEEVVGYHIYRAPSSQGPFTRLTTTIINTTNFMDSGNSGEAANYMVRAIKLQTNPSGSYYNPSQGIFLVVPGALITRVTARPSGNDLILTWNSQPGQGYRVFVKDTLGQAVWVDTSGSLTANSTSRSWTNTNFRARPHRFFKVGVD